jgi:Ala-tRNA(Pro) deacylase
MSAASPKDRQDELFAYLNGLDVAHTTHRHRPVFTVEDGADLRAAMPGGHTKNLFLKEKKAGALFLICALAETRIDLNAVSKLLGVGRFSFGSPDLLAQRLGVTPGSVTLFALINDPDRAVTLILDEALLACDPVNFHPLSNDATTALSPAGMLKFISSLGRKPIRLTFDQAGVPSRVVQ